MPCCVCEEVWAHCQCDHANVLLPMAPRSLRCGHPELAEMLKFRLAKRLLYNLLYFVDLIGPCFWLDCFVSSDFASQLTLWIWTLFRFFMGKGLDNKSAMVPSFIVEPLAALLALDIDIFSSPANNNFGRYCCDPMSPVSFLTQEGDGFHHIKYAPAVHGLCNPVFDKTFLHQFFVSVAWRMHQLDLSSNDEKMVLFYIGPPVVRADVHPSWATQICSPTCGTFPFHHPTTGILGGFPYPLEMWLLDNLSVHERATLITPLAAVLQFWTDKHNIQWSSDVGCYPGRSPKGWLVERCTPNSAICDALNSYEVLLTRPGRLPCEQLRTAHNRVQQLAVTMCHPAMLEAWYRYGVQWSANIGDPSYFSVYMVVCLKCTLLYVGSTTKSC